MQFFQNIETFLAYSEIMQTYIFRNIAKKVNFVVKNLTLLASIVSSRYNALVTS